MIVTFLNTASPYKERSPRHASIRQKSLCAINVLTKASVGDDTADAIEAKRGKSVSGREMKDANSETEGGAETKAQLQ